MDVIRTGWLATLSMAFLTAAGVVVVVGLVFGDLWFAVELAAMFNVVMVVFRRFQWVRLDASSAEVRNMWSRRTVARVDVQDVCRGGWLRGGMYLRTSRGRIWAPVSDGFLGRGSALVERVRAWAARG